MRALLGLALLLLPGMARAQLAGVALPGGGWLGWTLPEPRGARGAWLVRLDENGKAVARAQEPEVGSSSGSLALSPDGGTVFSAGENLAALDSRTLQARWSRASGIPIPPLAVSPDGRLLALPAGGSGDTALLDARVGTRLRVLKHPGPALSGEYAWNVWYRGVTGLAFSPDGRTLAIGSRGGGVRLRDLTSGHEARLISTGRPCPNTTTPRPTAHAGGVHTLRWLDAVTLLSAANDGTVRRWDVGTSSLTGCLTVPGGPQAVYDLPGGALGVVAGPFVRVLDARALRFTVTLGPHAGWVQTLRAFGGRFQTTDAVSTRTWNPLTGAQEAVTGPDLATVGAGDVRVRVLADMRVRVVRAGSTVDLTPLALPARNADNGGDSWKAGLSGDLLTVTATTNLRILTNETRDFSNVYTWNLRTGRLVGCHSTEDIYGTLNESGSDPACRTP